MAGGAPEPVAEPVAEPAAEPAWSGPSQEEWAGVMGYFQAQQEQQAAQQAWEEQQQQQLDPRYAALADPFNEQFGPTIAQELAAIRQEITATNEWRQGQQLNEAHDQALDIIADDVSRNGEFMLGEQAYSAIEALANTYIADEAARHGFGPKAAESALARAAGAWRQYEADLSKAAVERHMNQLSMLGGAPREPLGAQVAASSGLRIQPGGDELSVVSGFGGFPGRQT